jgi:hypothetical protein
MLSKQSKEKYETALALVNFQLDVNSLLIFEYFLGLLFLGLF